MAAGGVAIGIIKAQLADKVAGIINNLGSMLKTTAPVANIGSTNEVTAELEDTSVRKVTPTQIRVIIMIG